MILVNFLLGRLYKSFSFLSFSFTDLCNYSYYFLFDPNNDYRDFFFSLTLLSFPNVRVLWVVIIYRTQFIACVLLNISRIDRTSIIVIETMITAVNDIAIFDMLKILRVAFAQKSINILSSPCHIELG